MCYEIFPQGCGRPDRSSPHRSTGAGSRESGDYRVNGRSGGNSAARCFSGFAKKKCHEVLVVLPKFTTLEPRHHHHHTWPHSTWRSRKASFASCCLLRQWTRALLSHRECSHALHVHVHHARTMSTNAHTHTHWHNARHHELPAGR